MGGPLIEAGVAARIPVGRVGIGVEIAQAVMLLMRDAYITGQMGRGEWRCALFVTKRLATRIYVLGVVLIEERSGRFCGTETEPCRSAESETGYKRLPRHKP